MATRLQRKLFSILNNAIMKKDTCFNVGPNDIASYIEVDPNKLALKINYKKNKKLKIN